MDNDWIRLFLRIVFVYLIPAAIVVGGTSLVRWFPLELVVSLSVVLSVVVAWCMHFGLRSPEAWLAKRLFGKGKNAS